MALRGFFRLAFDISGHTSGCFLQVPRIAQFALFQGYNAQKTIAIHQPQLFKDF